MAARPIAETALTRVAPGLAWLRTRTYPHPRRTRPGVHRHQGPVHRSARRQVTNKPTLSTLISGCFHAVFAKVRMACREPPFGSDHRAKAPYGGAAAREEARRDHEIYA